MFWEAVRDRRLDGWKFRRQHAVGKYVVDFYCHELGLAIEIDGGIHARPENRAADDLRQSDIEQTGIRFLRIPTTEIEANFGATLTSLRTYLTALRDSTTRNILPSPARHESGEGPGVRAEA
jgi:very-short-patch-repair endonuclease